MAYDAEEALAKGHSLFGVGESLLFARARKLIHCLCDRAVDRIVHRSDVVEISRVATHGQDVTKEHPSQHAVLVNDLAKFKMKVESIQGMSVGLQRARPRGRRMAAGDPHPRQ
jgi:hypothetical protein